MLKITRFLSKYSKIDVFRGILQQNRYSYTLIHRVIHISKRTCGQPVSQILWNGQAGITKL